MRIWTRPVLGNSLETTRFFVNRSMTSRVLLLGLPLLTLVLLLVFLATGRSIEALVNRAIARNAQLHAQAMSLSLEQILTETRNQLLILAAGSMDPKDMVRRLQFRVRAEGLRYREVAFMGTDPSQRYLLLSYGGEIISIPPDIASATVGNPFTSLGAAQRPGHVQVSQPLEVVYSMVPLNDSVQSIPLYVIRFSTPIYDAQGVFQGLLILSLDLTVLRDAISMFSSSSAPLRAADDETRIRSFFFDSQGWMLFQSENLDADVAGGPFNSDSLRAGFQGEFGRTGFSTAFRPGPNHVNYWSMVSNVQAGHSGQIFLDNSDAWDQGNSAVEGVSFAPVTFAANPDSPRTIMGGLAVLDTSFTATRTGIQIIGIYGICLLAGICLLGLGLAWLARGTTQRLRRRKSDLPLLAVFFLTRAAESQGLPTPRLSRGALRKLQEYHWPGNVRELQNCLARALAFCENGLIFAENIQLGPDTLPGDIARPERGKLSCPPARADSRQPHGEAAETAESPVAQPVPAESEDQGAMPAAEDAQPRLNARLARLLPQIVELGSISRQEYQDMSGKDISMRTAQYDLQILVRLGLVRREGRGPAQRYIVLPAARGFRA